MRASRPPTANSRRAGLDGVASLASLLLGLTTLAGCVFYEPPGSARSALYDPNTQPLITAPAPAATGNETKTASLTPQVKPSPEPKIDADPKRLIGLDRTALIALLGKPAFERKDKPAEFWRYSGDSCMLDLYLYGPEKAAEKDKAVRVRLVAAHGPSDAPVDAGDCLRTILRARLASDAG
jgi:hypothetical protein